MRCAPIHSETNSIQVLKLQYKQFSQSVKKLNDNEACNRVRSGSAMMMVIRWVGLLPVLLDLQIPLPLQMLHLVIIREQALDAVRATRNHARRSFFPRCYVWLQLGFGSVAANHKRRFVNWNIHIKVTFSVWRLVHVLQHTFNTETLYYV